MLNKEWDWGRLPPPSQGTDELGWKDNLNKSNINIIGLTPMARLSVKMKWQQQMSSKAEARSVQKRERKKKPIEIRKGFGREHVCLTEIFFFNCLWRDAWHNSYTDFYLNRWLLYIIRKVFVGLFLLTQKRFWVWGLGWSKRLTMEIMKLGCSEHLGLVNILMLVSIHEDLAKSWNSLLSSQDTWLAQDLS